MKVYAVWIISILKFMLRGRRFLLLSPPFLKKQYWYDRLSQKRFVTLNRNMTDWGVSWQVFLDDQFTPLENIFNDSRKKDLLDYEKYQIDNGKQPLVIDCGSNSGASCIYFALTHPKAKIIGIEIDSDNYLHSLKNIELNDLDALVINKGISSVDGYGSIINPDADNDSFRIKKNIPGNNNNKVSMISMDKLFEDFPLNKFFPFIVKIDIEGGEDDLFETNTEWVIDVPMIIIELHDWIIPKKRTSLNFLKVISKLDRDFNIKGENVFSIKNKMI